MNSHPISPDLQLAFDVGHSSIGWAVLQKSDGQTPGINILGCGSVVFRANDCLVSSRRAYRRQRRHIRSTRQRIARMKTLLQQRGVLTAAELEKPGCAWPWKLSARVLQGGKLLTWRELWDVLRWYAHNRGYDGNRRWSAADEAAQSEDSEKEGNARTLMGKYAARSMAETFCAMCGINPLGKKRSANVPGAQRPKGQNAAFPREIVEGEVRKVLRAHFGNLNGVDANLETALFSDWRAIPAPGLQLPNRYQGGLLFGQLVPRFENRIISNCPVTWQKEFARATEALTNEDPNFIKLHRVDFAKHDGSWWASHIADKLAKVPSRNCPEFLNFRWAMQLANIRVGKKLDRELRVLSTGERKRLDQQMRLCGYLTPGQLKDAVRRFTDCERDNLDTMFMHPDAKEALLVDPVQKLITSEELRPFWTLFPERLQKRLRGQWRRGKSFSLAQIRSQFEPLGDVSQLDAELQKQLDAQNTKAKRKDKQMTRDDLLQRCFPPRPLKLDGRAAFARPLLKQAYEDVVAGKPHPKEAGGCLFISEEIRQTQLNRELADQTNNHLVRHRLLILERLLADIIKERDFADGRKERIGKITIEVNRDLREMSGMTAEEKAMDMGSRVANHHAVADKLEKAFAEESNGKSIPITAGLIRKARIAEDLGWRCPYTGIQYEPKDLITRRVDKDHIVPRSDRASDSLDSLAITFSAINKWKARRTAWQFVSEEQGKPVPDLPNLSIMSLSRYKQSIEGLEAFKGHDDDKRRKKRRKELLLLPRYEEKEFMPRDLTQTSQLVRLGAQVLRKNLPHLTTGDITSLPGSITGTVRKSWRVLCCLATANRQVLDEHGEAKNKTDIRDITHLHHALDACVLGLASHFIPNDGRIWELIVKRSPNDSEKRQLEALGVFGFNADKRFEMLDLDKKLKEQIRQRLAEKRVIQHIPARMDGLRVEQNTWRVVAVKDGEVILKQRVRQPDGTRPEKTAEEKPAKLLGLAPVNGQGKLATNKGALVIPENYGVALDPQPAIIPFHKVWPRLQELKKANGGKMPRILRNGQLIRVKEGNFKGLWRVFSAKNNATGMALDIGSPDVVRLKNKTEGHKINVRLASLLKGGLEPIRSPLSGISSK
jgi:CRISPR-associated endonuclease Csn1